MYKMYMEMPAQGGHDKRRTAQKIFFTNSLKNFLQEAPPVA